MHSNESLLMIMPGGTCALAPGGTCSTPGGTCSSARWHMCSSGRWLMWSSARWHVHMCSSARWHMCSSARWHMCFSGRWHICSSTRWHMCSGSDSARRLMSYKLSFIIFDPRLTRQLFHLCYCYCPLPSGTLQHLRFSFSVLSVTPSFCWWHEQAGKMIVLLYYVQSINLT